MGSKSKTNETQTKTQTEDTQTTGIDQYKQQFGQDYGNLMTTWQKLANDRPALTYTDNPFSSGFNPIVQNSISAGIANNKAAQTANDLGTANALSVAGTGDNAALLGVLQGQNKQATAGANNALYAPALAQQREFDVQNAGLMNQQNQTKLADYATQISAMAPGLNLLQQLQGMAGIAGGKKTTSSGTATGQSKTSKGFF